MDYPMTDWNLPITKCKNCKKKIEGIEPIFVGYCHRFELV